MSTLGGCYTLVVDEEIPPHNVKCFESFENRYVNVMNELTFGWCQQALIYANLIFNYISYRNHFLQSNPAKVSPYAILVKANSTK